MKLRELATLMRFSAWRRWLLLLAGLYVVLPTDLVPDIVPVLGWLDDLGLLSVAVALFLRTPRHAIAHDVRCTPRPR